MKYRFCVMLGILLVGGGAMYAGEYTQRYVRSDGEVLLEVNPRGQVKKSKKSWDEEKNAQCQKYFECKFQVLDKNGMVVNEQLVWFFPNMPMGGNTDKSNHWVYWCNPKTKAIWGRCPTPAHPEYNEWMRAKGVDLWQIVPEADRPNIKNKIKDPLDVSQAARVMGGTIGNKDKDMPKVTKDNKSDPIVCVDFENPTFAAKPMNGRDQDP